MRTLCIVPLRGTESGQESHTTFPQSALASLT